MAWDQYLCLGGVEIINGSRLCQMLGSGRGPEGIICNGCCPCPDLDKGLGYEGGYNPADNPWYDPLVPESNDFAGLLITNIVGLEPGGYTRPVTEAAGVGAVLGQGRNSAPQIVVTGILMAATCCAAEYGYQWLRSALKGSCGKECSGDDLTFLSCSPTFPDEDCSDNPDCLQDCLQLNPNALEDCTEMCAPPDFEALLAPYYRTFKKAALVAGPTVTQIIPRGCPDCYDCGLMEVQFTLSAGDPCIYRDPELVAQQSFIKVIDDTCVTWVDNTDGDADCSDCATEGDCSTDPNCQDTSPPSMPTIVNPCVEECISDTSWRTCFDIPKGSFPLTAEGTLIAEVYSGRTALRNVKIKVWENPLNLPADELEDCDICSSLAISYVPPNSTLTVDGSARTAMISCTGRNAVRANPFIASDSGSAAFTYPTFAGCGDAYTVCVTSASEPDVQAYVKLSTVARFC